MTLDQNHAMPMQPPALQPGRAYGAEGSAVVHGSIRTVGRSDLADHEMGLRQWQLSSSGGLSATSIWSMRNLRRQSDQEKHLQRVQRRAV
uniref:DRE-binding protein 1b n=1 Tax=Zea mays TaxID=4577 RepID=C3UZ66_MAIZE|nr:DRE-binding protein 1b [Zea mays]